MIQGHLICQNHTGIAPSLAAPTLSMVGFKCRLPGVAGFDLGPPSKRNPSRPFALPKFNDTHYIVKNEILYDIDPNNLWFF